ncbi:MAG: site-specific integrase [Dehalococcoidales bacterium]|nr:site-specific integrase [Dehalococcoidales bacterium]
MATLVLEDIPKFLEATQGTPYYILFYTALYTGMRLGELLGLRWCDIDLDMASLSVVQALYKRSGVCKMVEPKSSGSRRRIALSPSLVLTLRQYRVDQQVQRILIGEPMADSDLVFSHPGGKPLDPGVVSHTFAKVLRKAGLPHIRFHDLRHTHATLLLKAGVHPKIVSERLGHANIGITLDTYSHVLPGLQERAAESFDEMLAPGVIAEDVSKMLAKGPGPDSLGR